MIYSRQALRQAFFDISLEIYGLNVSSMNDNQFERAG